MTRPPRSQFPGAIYHITSRGVRRASIYLDRRDFVQWQEFLGLTQEKFGLLIYAYCQMPNHYHLLLATPQGNLSEAMHHLNSNYCQYFNVRHAFSGHVLQGRYHAELVLRQAHLLELIRYLPLNPVRAQLVEDPAQWPWSSHRHYASDEAPPAWLHGDWLRKQLGGHDIAMQRRAYAEFVNQGSGRQHPLATTRRKPGQLKASPTKSLSECDVQFPDKEVAMCYAFYVCHHTAVDIARHHGISARTVTRILRAT